MTTHHVHQPGAPMDDRLADLIIAAETDTISQAELAELRERLATASLDEVAALRRSLFAGRGGLRGSGGTQATALPAGLREKLRAAASAHLRGATPTASEPKPLRLVRDDAAVRTNHAPAWAFIGWFAAAAAVGFATFVYLNPPKPAVETPAWATVDQRADTIRVAFKPASDQAAGVRGEVVWNDALQTGYLLVTGLPKNDPTKSQYQLWLVDPKRDSKPVDGGVFDVVADGMKIPIHSKLAVDKPVAFAITEEQPGGVVVSDGPHLAVAARG